MLGIEKKKRKKVLSKCDQTINYDTAHVCHVKDPIWSWKILWMVWREKAKFWKKTNWKGKVDGQKLKTKIDSKKEVPLLDFSTFLCWNISSA